MVSTVFILVSLVGAIVGFISYVINSDRLYSGVQVVGPEDKYGNESVSYGLAPKYEPAPRYSQEIYEPPSHALSVMDDDYSQGSL